MKKSKVIVDQPMGIVIATGSVAPSNPRVKAYMWCDVEASGPNRSEDESHFVK